MRKTLCMAMALAMSVLFGPAANAAIEFEGYVAADDEVYFYEKFHRGEDVLVELTGDGNSDIDLWIYDEDDRLICKSTSDDSDEWCLWTPSYTQIYQIRVENYGHRRGSDFEITVE